VEGAGAKTGVRTKCLGSPWGHKTALKKSRFAFNNVALSTPVEGTGAKTGVRTKCPGFFQELEKRFVKNKSIISTLLMA